MVHIYTDLKYDFRKVLLEIAVARGVSRPSEVRKVNNLSTYLADAFFATQKPLPQWAVYIYLSIYLYLGCESRECCSPE